MVLVIIKYKRDVEKLLGSFSTSFIVSGGILFLISFLLWVLSFFKENKFYLALYRGINSFIVTFLIFGAVLIIMGRACMAVKQIRSMKRSIKDENKN